MSDSNKLWNSNGPGRTNGTESSSDSDIETGSSLALLGAVGGAGTTRTCLEFGGMLARDGRSVVILDAAYATQGLSDHVDQIACDITQLVLEDEALSSGLVDLYEEPENSTGGKRGRIACCPARAPFERIARAKTASGAQRFEKLIEEAERSFDHVLIDTPPVASNQAIAAVTRADRIGIVAPGTQRGSDGLARIRDRLADITVERKALRTIRTGSERDAAEKNWDTVITAPDVTDPARVPTSGESDSEFARSVAESVEWVLDVDLSVEFSNGV